MANYNVKLISKQELAEGTWAFYFEKPTDFVYQAGQFVRCTLINPPETDAEGNSRLFSLASAPYEAELMMAIRMRDTAFKRVLKSLPTGTEVMLNEPRGRFTLHGDGEVPAVFIT